MTKQSLNSVKFLICARLLDEKKLCIYLFCLLWLKEIFKKEVVTENRTRGSRITSMPTQARFKIFHVFPTKTHHRFSQ